MTQNSNSDCWVKMLFVITPMGQFHNIFGAKAEQRLHEKIFEAFNGNSIWQTCAKIWCSVQRAVD
jgi:hypothetical protein